MKKPFRKISVLIVLFSLFGIQNAASQGYVKLNALYALCLLYTSDAADEL